VLRIRKEWWNKACVSKSLENSLDLLPTLHYKFSQITNKHPVVHYVVRRSTSNLKKKQPTNQKNTDIFLFLWKKLYQNKQNM